MRLSLGILFGLALSLASFSLMAQTRETHKDWGIHCSPQVQFEKNCIMTQVLSNPQTDNVALSVVLAYQQGATLPLMLLRTPPEIQTDKGVGLRIDNGRPARFTQIKCDRNACTVAVGLDAATVDRLKRGRRAFVAYVPPSGRTTTVPVSLTGFTAAYNSLAQK